jgi:glutaredoxin
MIRTKSSRLWAACFGVALVGCVATAGADWLVTRGRTRIETRGAWQVKGGRVIFTDLGGRLVTLPVALLDIEASRRATAEASVAPDPTVVPATPTPLAVLTDSDVAHVGQGGALTAAAPESGQPAVTLYSARWCGWCRKTKVLLAELGVQYVERDIDREPAARSELLRLTHGSLGVPVLDIGGALVRGYSPDRIKSLLAAAPVSEPKEQGSSEEK